tara:strand:+ start:11495 stop:11785 length:291 start_codon:yes stop_codon:yes gene_type:complete
MKKCKPLGGTSHITFHTLKLSMPNEQKEGKAGDSLKIAIGEDGQITLDWDDNDPHWNFLSKLSTNEVQEFVESAIKNGLGSIDLSSEIVEPESDAS